jgi:Arc/MetJ family transcription regulator
MSLETPRAYVALALRRDTLVERLEAGYAKIDAGLAEGRDVAAWEDFWLALLTEYERVDDALRAYEGAV